jgi:hypothetical protein
MFLAVPRASSLVFMFSSPRLVFGGTEGVGSRFHVLCSRNRVRRYRGRRLPFSCFVSSYSFSAVPRATVTFSCFARPNSFSVVLRASGLVFMFCAPGFIFGGTEGVRSRFHVLRSRTRFRRYGRRRLPFSCFVRPDSFSAVPRASGPVFMLCALEHVFGCTEGVGSRFHVLCARTHFRRYRERRVPFSCFARPNSFLVVLRASGPIFMFCASELVFGLTEGVRSRFHDRLWCFAKHKSVVCFALYY